MVESGDVTRLFLLSFVKPVLRCLWSRAGKLQQAHTAARQLCQGHKKSSVGTNLSTSMAEAIVGITMNKISDDLPESPGISNIIPSRRPAQQPQPGLDGLLDDGTVRINVWASPRSLSTSLMYSFAQRPDTVVHDEPLYAHFLRTHPEEETWRPYRELVFKEQDSDGDRWIREVGLGPTPRPVVYMKHMSKQIRNLDLSFIPKCRNVLQIRNPIDMLPSWGCKLKPNLMESGILEMLRLYSLVRSIGQAPIVVDGDLLRKNPEGVLRELTDMLGIPYKAEQLSWAAGPKPYDGCWGYLWYKGCWASTSFDDSPRYATFDPKLTSLMEECMPIYQLLRAGAITGYGRLGKVPRPLPSTSSSGRDEVALGASLPNENVLVWVGGGLVPRHMAKLSVLDSSVQGGDAVWAGVRVYNGKIFMFERHLQRLHDSARALAFEGVPSPENVKTAIMMTLAANDMQDGVHVRVILTRGVKTIASIDPVFNTFGCSLIVLAEWSKVDSASASNNESGVKLVTSPTTTTPPHCLESVIQHNNLLNNIQAKITANTSGAADAVMLDVDGFVAGTSATNIFVVKQGVLVTPATGSCTTDILRELLLELAVELDVTVKERRVSLSELYAADEVFTAGTISELTAVLAIDGRQIGDGRPGTLTRRLRDAFADKTRRAENSMPLPEFRR